MGGGGMGGSKGCLSPPPPPLQPQGMKSGVGGGGERQGERERGVWKRG